LRKNYDIDGTFRDIGKVFSSEGQRQFFDEFYSALISIAEERGSACQHFIHQNTKAPIIVSWGDWFLIDDLRGYLISHSQKFVQM
jgi:hypothetical protein